MNFRTKQISATFTITAMMLSGIVTAQNIQEGLNLLNNDQYSKAQSVFENLISQNPTADNYYYLGYFYLKNENPNIDLAIQNFNKGLEKDPKSYLNKIGLAAVKLYQKNKSAANADFESIAKDTRYKNPEVLFKIAESYVLFRKNKDTMDPDKSIEFSNKLLELVKNKDKAEYYIVLGNAYYEKGDAGKAMSNYTKASEIANDKAEAYMLIANIYGRTSSVDKSLVNENFKKALAANASFAPTYKYLTDYNVRTQNYAEASSNWKKYIDLSGQNTGSNSMHLANIYFFAKDYTQALTILNQSWNSINDTSKNRLKANILLDKSDFSEALAAMNEYMKTTPDSEKTGYDYGLLGKIQYSLIPTATGEEKNKLTKEAIVNLSQAQSKGDKAFNYMSLIADLNPSATAGSNSSAPTNAKIESLKKAVASNPNDTKSLYELATEQYTVNDYIGSVATWDKLIALIPGWESSYAGKGMALYGFDRTDQSGLAAQSYQKYIDLVEPKKEYSDTEKAYLSIAYSFFAFKEYLADNKEKAQEYINKVLAVDPQNSDILNLQSQIK
ncbi:tetratricopeptide repeat protein [Apibacter sp. HY039]|uniref:tetratricopeptide repeat protein n=1 Tax=Apibacter sp. HY039 TaxID=2501476 RepID=UPI000FEBAF22|nr:tetratricopeptide repeat protein [Apibacter sp. HY039]